MLHVDPRTATSAAQPAFDPIAYLDYVRTLGVLVTARTRDGSRQLVWEIGSDAAAAAPIRNLPDPRLNIDGEQENENQVWEVLRAETYLAAARDCRLLIFPWCLHRRDGSSRGGVMTVGLGRDDDDDFSAGTDRLIKHRDGLADQDCRPGLLYNVLCREFGVEPHDPDLCDKVGVKLEAIRAEAGRVPS